MVEPDAGSSTASGSTTDPALALAPKVSSYLARVVSALADYEDRLLFEDGFFAREVRTPSAQHQPRLDPLYVFGQPLRPGSPTDPLPTHTATHHLPRRALVGQEHFEAQIDSLRNEFEQNRRAQSIFSSPDAVGLLIAQLVADPNAAVEAELSHSRRQQQFVFAASVLLTSSITVQTMRSHPQLIERLWAFLDSPDPLHPVQLQYWCAARHAHGAKAALAVVDTGAPRHRPAPSNP